MQMTRRRLAIVSTHPVQYYAPLFRRVAERGELDVRVFYGWEGLTQGGRDAGFAQHVQWDVPLLEGYDFTFVRNDSRKPGSHHPRGIASRDLVPAIKRWRPDAVLVIGWAFVSHFAALRAFHGRVPVLFRGDSTLLGERPGPSTWLRRARLRFVYRHVDVALYAGSHNRRYFQKHGLHEEQLMWMPHAVDNDRFRDPTGALAREAAAWRGRLGMLPDQPTAIFAGKLASSKAPDILLRAFNESFAGRTHLVYVGSGPLETTLRRMAANHRNVHFVGFQNQSQMPVAYRLGDVLVLPSHRETWGLAVNEAMACGIPVIVSDQVGCAPDLVNGRNSGTVFRSGDSDALGRSLLHLLGDTELRTAMGTAGQRLIQSWSFDAAAERLEKAVAGLVPSATRPAWRSGMVQT